LLDNYLKLYEMVKQDIEQDKCIEVFPILEPRIQPSPSMSLGDHYKLFDY
jgi:hypothetical protein